MKERFLRILAAYAVLAAVLMVYPFPGFAEQEEHKEQPVSEQRFKDIDFWVKMFEDPERDEWQKPAEVVKALDLKNGDVIADIGAGTGYFTRLFAKAVGPEGRALGLDIEPSMVEHMKEDAKKLGLENYEARVVRTDDPELAPGSIDVVFICNTYHHIEDRVNYLRNMSRGLKKDGRAVIVDFYENSPVGPQDPGHKLSEKVVHEEFKQAGYDLIKSHKILDHQYFLEFKVRH